MAVARIHIRLSEQLKKKLDEQVKADGYGARGKSKWIRESIRVMEKNDRQMKYLGQGDHIDGPHKKSELITVPFEISSLIADMLLRFRVREPGTDVDRSLLLRSAIRYRLRNPDLFIAKPSPSSVKAKVVPLRSAVGSIESESVSRKVARRG